MKRLTIAFSALLPLAALCPEAFGQAAVEYGLGASRAAISTAPAAGLGKSIKGVFDSVNKTLEPAVSLSPSAQAKPQGRSKQLASPSAKKAAETPAAQAEKGFENPQNIQSGIEYDELLRRFGPPSMSVTSESGGRALSYSTKDGLVQVAVENGKVVSIGGR